jgi:PAS domain S-box-containing protein
VKGVTVPGNQDPSAKFEKLRHQAEELIRQQPASGARTPATMLDLIHELRIHQAELEIQNEELRQAQQELACLHREYEELYEFAPVGYLTLDARGLMTRLNLTGCRLLGATRQFIPGQSFSRFLVPGWEDAFRAARVETARTGEQQSLELPVKRDNGNPLWVRADIEAAVDAAGQARQWRVTLVDITAKRLSEVALQQSESRFRSMLEAMTDGVYVCSAGQTIEYMNPAMIKRIGRDATGEVCFRALHGFDQPCKWCRFEGVRNGETQEGTIESPLDRRSYRITSMPVVSSDKTISKLTIYRDVTDYLNAVAAKEKAQAELHQAEKMESIGNLAGGIAHDFNNVLASVIGFAELALEDAEEGSSLEDNLQEIYLAGKRAKELVRQILTFARKSNEEVKPVNMSHITQESINFLRSSVTTNIDIRPQVDSGALVIGNPALLQQILLNLGSNAADAMQDKGGTLKISLADVNIDDRTAEARGLLGPGDHVQLIVSDTGGGIPPEVLSSVFEPYFTTKAPGHGTGMGLASVHGTVKKYGGAVRVESQKGQGTVVTVWLPTVLKRDTAAPYQAAELPTGTERILFVDDEAPIAKMSQQILERLGYRVTTRTSSVEALALFSAGPDEFDLVITDVSMPVLTGDKLAAEMMKVRPDIPVILCTGYSNRISDVSATEIGIKAFAHKPIVMTDLANTVRTVLDAAGPADKT